VVDITNKIQRAASQCSAGIHYLGHLWTESADSARWHNDFSVWQTGVGTVVFVMCRTSDASLILLAVSVMSDNVVGWLNLVLAPGKGVGSFYVQLRINIS